MSIAIVSSGSIDGILSTATLVNYFESQGDVAEIVFTQAFTLNQVSLGLIPTKFVLVGLDVDHNNPQNSKDWLIKSSQEGHILLGIADEHRGDVWKSFVVAAGYDYDHLLVHPKSRQDGYLSAGAVLLEELRLNDWQRKLCQLSTETDQGNFSGVTSIINEVVKADIRNDNKRVHISRALAKGEEFFCHDKSIKGWIKEAEHSKQRLTEIVNSAKWDGCIACADAGDYGNITGVMMSLYIKGAKFAIVRGLARDESKGGMFPVVSVGVPKGSLDITGFLRENNIEVPIGFEMKASFRPEEETRVLELLRTLS
ncbi:MAG: hypothetical protein KatS3mg087_0594 [Patescibacteria group bacterium]|nr:MAG: hypothetical protein KatS3mg087_0594 [Patescibacteria group bacterium]